MNLDYKKIISSRSQQMGRSMVEMLGVLSVMGILTLGALAGYRYGMDKYRANVTINDINMRGVDLVIQANRNIPLNLEEWETTSTAGYAFKTPAMTADGYAWLGITGIPKRICEIVAEGILANKTTEIDINQHPVYDTIQCDETNDMDFYFMTGAVRNVPPEQLCNTVTCDPGYTCELGICLKDKLPSLSTNGNLYCHIDSDCGECQYCDGSGCQPKADGEPCGNGRQECQKGMCVDTACESNDDCQHGYFCANPDSSSNSNENKTCIRADFNKVVLDTGQVIYISQSVMNVKQAVPACDAIGKNLLDASVLTSRAFVQIMNNNGFTSARLVASDGSLISLSKGGAWKGSAGVGFAICSGSQNIWEVSEYETTAYVTTEEQTTMLMTTYPITTSTPVTTSTPITTTGWDTTNPEVTFSPEMTSWTVTTTGPYTTTTKMLTTTRPDTTDPEGTGSPEITTWPVTTTRSYTTTTKMLTTTRPDTTDPEGTGSPGITNWTVTTTR